MSTFQPSTYSYGGDYGFALVQGADGNVALRARNNKSTDCTSFKKKADKYRDLMWQQLIFSHERQAYENKAIAEDNKYLACMEERQTAKGKVKDLDKKKAPAKTTGGQNMPPPPPKDDTSSIPTPDDQAPVAPASSVPGILLLLGGVVAVGGIGYFLFHRKGHDKHKKHGKHGKHGEHDEHAAAIAAAPLIAPAPILASGVH